MGNREGSSPSPDIFFLSKMNPIDGLSRLLRPALFVGDVSSSEL